MYGVCWVAAVVIGAHFKILIYQLLKEKSRHLSQPLQGLSYWKNPGLVYGRSNTRLHPNVCTSTLSIGVNNITYPMITLKTSEFSWRLADLEDNRSIRTNMLNTVSR